MANTESISLVSRPDEIASLSTKRVDYIIVGGGSAGCVLANRLSAISTKTVVLLEAGADWINSDDATKIRDPGTRTIFSPELYWPNAWAETTAGASEDAAGRIGMAMLARALGGGSLVNGMQAGRGLPRDYDDWQQLGVQGWNWNDVLPYFNRVERDLNFHGPMHGNDGPIQIQRVPEQQWSRLSLALRTALQARGIKPESDFNDASAGDGVGPVPLNFGEGIRMSTSNAYLPPEIRRRPNLTLATDATVDRILFQDNRAIGVNCKTPQGEYALHANEILVCCGAVNSPALLQRSGVGPSDLLQAAGVHRAVERDGVGKNLQNHPIVSINAHLRPSGRRASSSLPPCVMVARYSSRELNCPSSDMFINFWERLVSAQQSTSMSRQMADLMVQLNKSYSRGDIRIDPANPNALPRIRFKLLSDERDRKRLVQGTLFVLELLRDPSVAPLINDVFISKFTPRNVSLMLDTPSGRFLSRIAALAMDGPGSLRRRLLRDSTISLSSSTTSNADIARLVDENVIPAGHSVGTCRMGRPDDPSAVTDSRCRVIGSVGLRVVDASIFPSIMTAGTNLPVMMAAEKAAAMIIEDSK